MGLHAPRVLGSLALLMFAGCEATPATAPEPAPAEPPGPQLRFVPAEAGELTEVVQAFMAEAREEQRAPLIYVGATWCEPCQYFHEAAERGELDDQLPRLALLELDLDQDAERLEAAGCRSQMIPLFAVPGADGRCTDRRIEGSIHGPGSPAQILPRLLGILGTGH